MGGRPTGASESSTTAGESSARPAAAPTTASASASGTERSEAEVERPQYQGWDRAETYPEEEGREDTRWPRHPPERLLGNQRRFEDDWNCHRCGYLVFARHRSVLVVPTVRVENTRRTGHACTVATGCSGPRPFVLGVERTTVTTGLQALAWVSGGFKQGVRR